MLAQELFHEYHVKPYLPRIAFKIDIRKAYDTLRWDFLSNCLKAFDFPLVVQQWIMQASTTAHFSVNINGELHGYFQSGRGLRQGDPLAPYLFILAMEIYSGILSKTAQDPKFSFHWRCKKNKISHLFFADDVLLFGQGDLHTITLLRDAVGRFAGMSGLVPNLSKSECFVAGNDPSIIDLVAREWGIKLGTLPVKYLGLPLSSKKIQLRDCRMLIDNIKRRAGSCANRTLSYAGRLTLVKHVLQSMQVYWSMVFILPKAVLHEVDKICRSFLWKGPGLQKGGAKVAWKTICLPFDEGGLGLRNLCVWNKALLLKQVWNFVAGEQTVWTEWIKANLIGRENFWVMKEPKAASWNWRKILQLRCIAQEQISWKVGDGSRISLWYDNWSSLGPLYLKVSNNFIYNSRISRNATLSSFISNGSLHLPQCIYSLFQGGGLPMINGVQDQCTWGQKGKTFTTASAWELIRPKAQKVSWAKILWHKNYIPRHSFIAWLVVQRKLHTQDRLVGMGRSETMHCVFCTQQLEDHDHLFFRCRKLKPLFMEWASMWDITMPGNSIVDHFEQLATKLGKNMVGPLMKASFCNLVYAVWKARNDAMFREMKPSPITIKQHMRKALADIAASKRYKMSSRERNALCKWRIQVLNEPEGANGDE